MLRPNEHKFVPEPLLSDPETLQFKWLSAFSDVTNSEIVAGLYQFTETYKQWIEILKKEVVAEGSENKAFADFNIAQCESDYKRIHSNIALLLDGNDRNIDSFRLMNSAMFIQLWHSKNRTKAIPNTDFYRQASDHIYGAFPAA